MPKQVINPPDVHQPTGYSHAVKKGNIVYIAGQVALDVSGSLVGKDDIEAQTEQAFRNLKAVVEAAGGTIDDIVKINIYTTDLSYRDTIREARNRYFSSDLPASTFVVISSLANPDLLVEIEAVAILD